MKHNNQKSVKNKLLNYLIKKIHEYCEEKQRKTSDSSIKQYAKKIINLLVLLDIEPHIPFTPTIFHDTRKVLQFLESNYSPASVLGYLFSIWYLCDVLENDVIFTNQKQTVKSLRNEYFEIWKAKRDIKNKKQSECIPTASQMKNWISYDKLVEHVHAEYKRLRPKTRYKRNWDSFRDLALLTAQTFLPRRYLDYSLMRIAENSQQLSDELQLVFAF